MSGELLDVRQAMGEWLRTLGPWDVFLTGTWSHPVTLSGALYGVRRYVRIVEKRAGVPDYAFVGLERGNNGGLLHAHGLLGNVQHVKAFCGNRRSASEWGLKCCLLHAWPWGYARVLPYDSQLGAAYYVSKHVGREFSEWDLVGFPAKRQPALTGAKNR